MATRDVQARYRAKARQRGKLKRYDKARSLFDIGEFVAVDGEGFNVGPEIVRHVGADKKEYISRKHEYSFLSSSDGTELYNPYGRLTTKQCLDFLIDIQSRQKSAILVCFGASYDMTHMLAFGLEREDLDILLHGEGKPFSRNVLSVTLSGDGETHDYRIELRNRKSLTVWRWEHGSDKYERKSKKDGTTSWKNTCKSQACLWDVWGFFQSSFVDALSEWLPGDADYEFIKREKGNRNVFDRSEIDTIRRYNAAELRCLVSMMDRVREGVRTLGLKIKRWDGAGAIAAAMLDLHAIKDHMATSPPHVFEAARHAYSGGHIEAFKLGHYMGTVYHYDINSAYPDQFRNLPSLRHGVWRSGNAAEPVPRGFTLVRLEFRFEPGLPFYPLFYRQTGGNIVYPERGGGWYWFPEFDTARRFVQKFGAIEFRVIEWHHFETQSNEAPFAFISGYYEQRKAIVAESKRTGIPNGAEKTLKLGYNSCYGKAAQQVGARIKEGEIVPPVYFQLEWAGYVTAGCRAKLMDAAMQDPDAIISVATDGIFSIRRLDLYTPKTKELGAWDFNTHLGITIVMPGIYWLHDEPTEKRPNGQKAQYRGFDREAMKDSVFVRHAWKQVQDDLDVPSERLITLGSSLVSDDFWEMRGMFVKTRRMLTLNGNNSKRYPISIRSTGPHRKLVDTHPRDLLEDYTTPLDRLMSAPYPITWLDYTPDDFADDDNSPVIADADRAFYFDTVAARLS